MLTAENTIHFGRYATKPLTNKMGTPAHMENGRNIRLRRGILKTLREKHNALWIDINQLIGDPEIFEFFGDIVREEIDGASMKIDRSNSPDAIKIEKRLNDETSVEYMKSNSGTW